MQRSASTKTIKKSFPRKRESVNIDDLVKSQEFPPPRRGRVRVGVVSCRIQSCLFPLPFVPSRQGRGKGTFYEGVNIKWLINFLETEGG